MNDIIALAMIAAALALRKLRRADRKGAKKMAFLRHKVFWAGLLVSLLTACAATQEQKAYCADKGYAPVSAEFQQCLEKYRDETRRTPHFRRGRGGGAGG